MPIVRKTSKEIKPMTQERAEEIMAMSDEDIDYSDIPELDDHFWENAKTVTVRSEGFSPDDISVANP